MIITRVEFFGESNHNFIRYAMVVIDGMIVIKGIKLIKRPDDTILVAMPSKKKIDDSYEEIVHPVNKTARKIIEQAVLNAWAVNVTPAK